MSPKMGNCEDIRKRHRGRQSARDRAFDLSDLVQVRMKNWHCEGSPPSKPMFLMMDPEMKMESKQVSDSSDDGSLPSQIGVSKRRSARIPHPRWDDDYLPLSVLGE